MAAAAAADDIAPRGVGVLCSRRRRPEAEQSGAERKQGSGSSEQAKWATGTRMSLLETSFFFSHSGDSCHRQVGPVAEDDKEPPGFWSGSRKREVTEIARGVPCKWACLSDTLIPRCVFSPGRLPTGDRAVDENLSRSFPTECSTQHRAAPQEVERQDQICKIFCTELQTLVINNAFLCICFVFF